MTTEQYAEKLRAFNSTEKYKKELEFLSLLLGTYSTRVLDYGAGLGTAVNFLKTLPENTVPWIVIDAIEPAGYYEGSPEDLVLDSDPNFYDCVYFMHSLAHIKDVDKVLKDVRDNLLADDGKVVVITPNASYIHEMSEMNKEHGGYNYNPDPTVVRHFFWGGLYDLFARSGFKINQLGTFGQEVIKGHCERLFLVASK